MSEQPMLSMQERGLEIQLSEDGVWLRFRTRSGKEAAINLVAYAKERPNSMISNILLEWCSEQATPPNWNIVRTGEETQETDEEILSEGVERP